MRFINVFIITACLHFLPSIVYATSAGVVQALQMPVWIKTGDIKKALKPGMEINTGDTIITGKYSRVLINLEEGSQVKIGANSIVNFNMLQPAEEVAGFFEGIIRVLKGAFRFTTTVLGQNRLRNLTVNIGAITVGIRGTDIWGGSFSNEDNLVLIEGRISAQRKGEPAFELTEALSWYRVPDKKPAQKIQTIPQHKLARWSAKTELLMGGGVLSINGAWAVNLMALKNKDKLMGIRLNMARQGYTSSMQEVIVKGSKWYRLTIRGFQSKADASIFTQMIEGKFDIRQPWVARF